MPIKNQLMNLMGKTEQPVKVVPAPAVAPSKPAPAPKPSAPSAPVPKLEPSEVKQVAEASLSPQLLRKLLSDEKLSTDEQKQVAAVCRQAGFL